jgi:hypothetical protein
VVAFFFHRVLVVLLRHHPASWQVSTLHGNRFRQWSSGPWIVEHRCRDARCVAEALFVKVAIRVERFDAYIGYANRAFQQTPEILKAIRMQVAINVGFGMVNDYAGGVERRCSERFPADDVAEVEVSGDSTFTLSGFMRDVSQMGLRLALPERVSPGAKVRISVRGGSTTDGRGPLLSIRRRHLLCRSRRAHDPQANRGTTNEFRATCVTGFSRGKDSDRRRNQGPCEPRHLRHRPLRVTSTSSLIWGPRSRLAGL